MNLSIFSNKRVLLTGHTGFKGSWLAIWLQHLGAQVYGYSLPPPTLPSNYELSKVDELLCGETLDDIRNRERMAQVITSFKPEVIFHLAAQPLVRDSYEMPYETFDINVMGTASVLDGVRGLAQPCAVICITTDKCYENREQVWGYRECDPMGGHDPYSASKGAAELLISAYRRSFFNPEQLAVHGVQLASARAGNVIGGGDWAKDRIITDVVSALQKGIEVKVRNPAAIRPWQHVLEPLYGYLTLAGVMLERPDAKWCSGWNFGPVSGSEFTVGELVDEFVKIWGSGSWQDCSASDHPHEANILRLSIDKAMTELGWQPRWSYQQMIQHTAKWYHNVLEKKEDALMACEDDLKLYGAFN